MSEASRFFIGAGKRCEYVYQYLNANISEDEHDSDVFYINVSGRPPIPHRKSHAFPLFYRLYNYEYITNIARELCKNKLLTEICMSIHENTKIQNILRTYYSLYNIYHTRSQSSDITLLDEYRFAHEHVSKSLESILADNEEDHIRNIVQLCKKEGIVPQIYSRTLARKILIALKDNGYTFLNDIIDNADDLDIYKLFFREFCDYLSYMLNLESMRYDIDQSVPNWRTLDIDFNAFLNIYKRVVQNEQLSPSPAKQPTPIIKQPTPIIRQSTPVKQPTQDERVAKKLIFETEKKQPSSQTYYQQGRQPAAFVISDLRNFHNNIKRKLIYDARRNGITLLDVSGGKGGDLDKWQKAGISHVLCADYSYDNLFNEKDSATVRYMKMKGVKPKIDFIQADSRKMYETGDAGMRETDKRALVNFYNTHHLYYFDIVCCMFSIHYFMEDVLTFHTFINNVSNNLKKGGKFIITALDGQRVFDVLKNTNPWVKRKGDQVFVSITKKYTSTKLENFGQTISVYNINIGGDAIDEYLVNTAVVKDVCLAFGLELSEIRHFDRFQGFDNLTPVEKDYSRLHVAMTFTKTT